ncbi:MAG: hypothetical protein JSW38_04895 [Dehalococcoidia bacterium]|nr:MAG: hypothetical protein JSW38_04895 [Dehalococcoidia bacterium]
MRLIKRYMPLSRIIMIMAVASLVMGVVFIVQGVTKADWMTDAMRLEQVTVGLSEEAIENGNVVDTAAEAQAAGDTIREHRRGIAATYNELLGGGRYDPTNPDHLTYAQALNMENYLYLGVLGFGVTQIAMAAGAFMIFTGIGLGAASLALRRRPA